MSRNLIIYHGTSAENARKIMTEGFKVEGVKRNWEIASKEGFVYFSLAYAPFYAMSCDSDTENEAELALIKVSIAEEDLYPEDDFIMLALHGKSKYDAEDLAKVDFEKEKGYWTNSLLHMGNVAAKPDKVKILGVRYFKGRELIQKCDPVISPMNFKIMGQYYYKLTKWIYEGKKIMDFEEDIIK